MSKADEQVWCGNAACNADGPHVHSETAEPEAEFYCDQGDPHDRHPFALILNEGRPDLPCGVCGHGEDDPWHAPKVADCTHLAGPPIERDGKTLCGVCGVQLLHEPTAEELASIGDSEVAEFAALAGLPTAKEYHVAGCMVEHDPSKVPCETKTCGLPVRCGETWEACYHPVVPGTDICEAHTVRHYVGGKLVP